MEALMLSPMLEGGNNKLNLALDSSALREDRYFTGKAIAVSLVHGGPPPGFFSPTLYSCLVSGKSSVKPVSECASLDDLVHTTEPLQDYLANAGCLRTLKSIEERDLLVQDILMFQVVHRVSGPLVFSIQMYPDSFRPLFCHEPSPLTAEMMDHLFHIRLPEMGSNERRAEELVGPSKLGKILAFARGASVIPPVGFSPQPSVEFLHDQSMSPKLCLLFSNTCINCLKLPLLDKYEHFRESTDFALGNTQGFGRESLDLLYIV
ncbi:hypothetical protein Q5P01_012987 [Channa striata]|uniref:HECT domain-containing protein n=1 Tax=Channa striata TaxID=64152 RepID=A0AA88MQH6_CHASR|nr:hypothetical protein Q5P01_012987 [Channa striata]